MGATRTARGTPGERSAKARRTEPTDRLVETATVMFNRFGIHATGIDSILEQSGVARMTLYNRFGSKSGLVREVLRRESLAWFDRLATAFSGAGVDPREKLSVYFDVLRSWFSEPEFKGCGFMNAVGESTLDDDCVRPIARAHRQANVDFIRDLLGPEVPAAAALAETIVMIADGATVDVMVTGDIDIVERARGAALSLFDLKRYL